MKKPPPDSDFSKVIANKERRKIYARRAKPYGGDWFGLGFAGLVGWSIVAPTLLGMAIGIWLDFHFSGSFSWTLTLMLGGLTLGCLVAWEWVMREQKRLAKAQPPEDVSPSTPDNPNPEEIS